MLVLLECKSTKVNFRGVRQVLGIVPGKKETHMYERKVSYNICIDFFNFLR